jgi:ABC-type bacteriocin/lantibiotic exporter with double-glycine peptidase domain
LTGKGKGRVDVGDLDDGASVRGGANTLNNIGGTPSSRKIYLDFKSSDNMVAQSNDFSCGPACGSQFLKDLGLNVDEATLIRESKANSFIGGTTADDLSDALNNVQDTFKFNGGVVGAENFSVLADRGPFIANIKPTSSGQGHFVIVDEVDGNIVKLRDPDPSGLNVPQNRGLEATITLDEFTRAFERSDGTAVFIERKLK